MALRCDAPSVPVNPPYGPWLLHPFYPLRPPARGLEGPGEVIGLASYKRPLELQDPGDVVPLLGRVLVHRLDEPQVRGAHDADGRERRGGGRTGRV